MISGLRHLWDSVRSASFNTRRFLLGTFLMGFGHGAIWVHLNLYLRSLGLDESEIGWIISAGSIGVVLISLPAAMWIDRFRAERVFVTTALGFGISMLGMLVAARPLVLMAVSLLSGMFFTVHLVAAAPFYMRNSTREHRTELFGISSALETLATVVSSAGVGVLARFASTQFASEARGLRLALVAAAVVSLAAAIPLAGIRSKPVAAERRSLRDYVYSRNMGLMFRLSLPAFLIGCGAGLSIPFLNLYFRDRFQQDPAQIGVYFSVAQVLTMTGFILGPILARRFTHVRAIVATELLSIPFFLLLALADRLWMGVLAFWMRGALMNMNQPVSNAFAMEMVSEDEQTVTNSLRTFAWNLAWMVTTPVGGWLIERQGYAANMFLTIAFYLTAASLFWTFFRGRVVTPKVTMPVAITGRETEG
jgi:predicted MFS family arabinose efflux permease